jgi:transcriptional regulator with XRE-family HTH domain
MNVITGAQLRAARALRRWSAQDVARRSGIGIATVRRAEAEDGPPHTTPANLKAICEVLQKGGIEFITENGGGVGVRMRRRYD